MATPIESEKTVRRIATMPNGYAQAAMDRRKPTHTGNVWRRFARKKSAQRDGLVLSRARNPELLKVEKIQ